MKRLVSPYFSNSTLVNNDKSCTILKMENLKEEEIKLEPVEEKNSPVKKKPRKPPIKVEYSSTPPHNWEMVYSNIQKMRESRTAPVDTMGCERAHDDEAEPAVRRFQCLVSLMLSSQTKDEVNFAAMLRLRQHGLTVENILKTSEEKLQELIFPVGFWRNKAKYLLETSRVLRDQYNSDIPDSVKELCKLKGVGPKMAHITMNVAWGKQEGIGVDTHVHRICGRLGWTQNCNQPEETRQSLEKWLPSDKWTEINWLFVGFGQETCLPVGPKCGQCINRQLCPTGRTWQPSPKKMPKSQKSQD